MKFQWKQHTKNGATWMRPNLYTCPFSIQIATTRGSAHKVYDIRTYNEQSLIGYGLMGESISIQTAQKILRDLCRKEMEALRDHCARYVPRFLDWCKSYEEEVQELENLIDADPSDVKTLKDEYRQLTGKNYRKDSRS